MSADTSNLPTMLPIDQFARECSLSRSTVYQMMDGGHLPYIKIPGTRTRRIHRDEIAKILAGSQIGPVASPLAPAS